MQERQKYSGEGSEEVGDPIRLTNRCTPGRPELELCATCFVATACALARFIVGTLQHCEKPDVADISMLFENISRTQDCSH